MSKRYTEWSLVIALLVVLIALAIFIAYLPAHGQVDPMPMPTMSSTSWVATPTMIPTMPTPDGLYHNVVYLPLIGGG